MRPRGRAVVTALLISCSSPQPAVIPIRDPSLARSLDARKCPLGRFGNDLFCRAGQPLQELDDSSMSRSSSPQAGIPKRDAGVTHQPAPFRAFDRAVMTGFAKFGFTQAREPFKPGKEERLVGARERLLRLPLFHGRKNPRLEVVEGCDGRASVPGTHVLTNITTKNMTSYRLAKLWGDAAAQLDGQVRDALPRIQHVRFDEGFCRTGVQALPAIPA
jgi:hypothetical protein